MKFSKKESSPLLGSQQKKCKGHARIEEKKLDDMIGTKILMITAYVTAIPALLVLAVVAPVVMLLAVPPVFLLVFRKQRFSARDSSSDDDQGRSQQHAIITGGSSGIGLAIALDCIQRGMERVTIIARNQEKLDQAKELLLEKGKSCTKVNAISVDICDPAAMSEAASRICGGERDSITLLFACAGTAHPGKFSELSPEIFAQQVQTNYHGTVYTVHAFLPFMQKGTIVLTSSAAGQVGIFGYSAYAPSKSALRSFAEALHMEMTCRDVNVQVVYPPDTDTPGYQVEQLTKPEECYLISKTTGLMQPEDVATIMVREAVKPNPKFSVYFGLEGWMLSTLTAGMSPESSMVDVLCQVCLMGLFRFVSFFYLNDFWEICRNCYHERQREAEA